MPRFSVVVPAYNAHATLAETLDSIAAQDFRDWECVVVDDGSTDSTAEVAASYAARDPRFRLVRQANAGTAGAYRTGIAEACADLLVICSADDMLAPAHLGAMDAFITRNDGYDIYSANGEFLTDETGERRPVYSGPPWDREHSLSFEDVVAACFYSVGVVFRRGVIDRTGGHRADAWVDDYDLWLRALLGGARHRYLPQVLSVHRVSSFQKSADEAGVFAASIEALEHLLSDPRVTPDQRAAIDRSIDNNREMIAQLPVTRAMERQSRAMRRAVRRIVGPRHVDTAMRVIHAVSWIVRPLRRLLARGNGR